VDALPVGRHDASPYAALGWMIESLGFCWEKQ
jgi:hypothetical protein